MTVPGRNAPCICGSGKKFKRCCSPDAPGKREAALATENARLAAETSARDARIEGYHEEYELQQIARDAELAAAAGAAEIAKLGNPHDDVAVRGAPERGAVRPRRRGGRLGLIAMLAAGLAPPPAMTPMPEDARLPPGPRRRGSQ